MNITTRLSQKAVEIRQDIMRLEAAKIFFEAGKRPDLVKQADELQEYLEERLRVRAV